MLLDVTASWRFAHIAPRAGHHTCSLPSILTVVVIFLDVTIFFSGIHGFMEICSRSSPMQVITMLNALYACFDEEIKRHEVYRLEAIGDLFMLASGKWLVGWLVG